MSTSTRKSRNACSRRRRAARGRPSPFAARRRRGLSPAQASSGTTTAQNSSSLGLNPGCGPATRSAIVSRKMPPGVWSPSVSNRYVSRIEPRSRRRVRPLASTRLNGRPRLDGRELEDRPRDASRLDVADHGVAPDREHAPVVGIRPRLRVPVVVEPEERSVEVALPGPGCGRCRSPLLPSARATRTLRSRPTTAPCSARG